jgi:hypothetical protein
LNKVTERLAVSRDRVTKLQKVTTTRDLWDKKVCQEAWESNKVIDRATAATYKLWVARDMLIRLQRNWAWLL